MPTAVSEGKPRLFFASARTEREWRFKEKVVAVVESYLQGLDDLYVFSPAKIKNKVGDPTEVDVAFAPVSDPRDVFRMVQVRDRGRKPDKTWVEQVIGQRTTMGQKGMTLVSTTPFSSQAARLAAAEQITLRILVPETDAAIRTWFSSSTLAVEKPVVQFHSCSAVCISGGGFREYTTLFSGNVEPAVFVQNSEGAESFAPITLRRVFDVDFLSDPDRDSEREKTMPRDNQFHNATIVISYGPPRLFVHGDGAMHPVGALVFFVRANRQYADYPISHRFRYVDAHTGKMLAQAVVAEIPSGKEMLYFVMVNNMDCQTTHSIGGAMFA